MSVRLFLIFLSLCAINSRAFAEGSEKSGLRLNVNVSINSDNLPREIKGSLRLKAASDNLCFYLPYNNPEFRAYDKVGERFEFSSMVGSSITPSGGSIEVSSPHKELRDYLIQLNNRVGDEVLLEFTTRVPRFATDHPDQWYFYDFYPQVLDTCGDAAHDPVNFRKSSFKSTLLSLSGPQGWDLLSSFESTDPTKLNVGDVPTGDIAFALTRGLTKSSIKVDDLTIRFAFRDEKFLRLVPTIQRAYRELRKFLPKLPTNQLWMIESTQFEGDELPGLIPLNRARQESLQNFQSEWLNWAHWASVTYLARQWFGAFIKHRSFNDEWLMRGSAEYASLQVLEKMDTRFDFFNIQDGARSFLDMNYRELNDLGLTILYQSEPHATLTDKNLQTSTGFRNQHPMLSLKHAATLRHLQSVVGRTRTEQALSSMAEALMFRPVSPRDYFDALKGKSTIFTESPQIEAEFLSWWQEAGWADFELSDFSQKEQKSSWQVDVKVKQEGRLNLSSKLFVTDSTGAKQVIPFASNSKREASLSFQSKHKVRSVNIDEDREVFDVDRFNNSSDFSSISLFPGNAHEIPDDGYTLVWLPYPFRRPGQAWSLALQTGLFRYIDNVATLGVETELKSPHRTAFTYRQSFNNPSRLLRSQLMLNQNIYGSRTAELNGNFGPMIFADQAGSLGSALRHRQVVGEDRSRHLTYAFSFDLKPKGQQRYATYHTLGEYERAPKQRSDGFSYERSFAVADFYLFAKQWFDLNLRLFRGDLQTSGEVPEEIYFRPEDIEEARLRIDQDGVERTSSLFASSADLFLPVALPIRDLGVLTTSRLKWRLFYDFGKDLAKGTAYRGSGLGFDAPLGGDLSGVGTLAVSKVSFMTILYSAVDKETSQRPRILFNIGSEF